MNKYKYYYDVYNIISLDSKSTSIIPNTHVYSV